MFAKKTKTFGLIFLLGGIMIGCVATPGPKGWLPNPKQALKDTYGAWIIAEYDSAGVSSIVEGEFIAIDSVSVYILNETGIAIIPIVKTRQVTLATYKEGGMVRTLALLGTLSTASHGYYAGISLPIWLATGISNAAAESSSGIIKPLFINWKEFAKYARFPQGIPEGINFDTIRPKKTQKK
ncbi:MAG: hypothetical protein JSV17_00095 [Candidatus Aminicenantes bacterium]|nr:MAG: hypothetical protein JSV17_00095 [Candidatus Aminicenantes bacterium]